MWAIESCWDLSVSLKYNFYTLYMKSKEGKKEILLFFNFFRINSLIMYRKLYEEFVNEEINNHIFNWIAVQSRLKFISEL